MKYRWLQWFVHDPYRCMDLPDLLESRSSPLQKYQRIHPYHCRAKSRGSPAVYNASYPISRSTRCCGSSITTSDLVIPKNSLANNFTPPMEPSCRAYILLTTPGAVSKNESTIKRSMESLILQFSYSVEAPRSSRWSHCNPEDGLTYPLPLLLPPLPTYQGPTLNEVCYLSFQIKAPEFIR